MSNVCWLIGFVGLYIRVGLLMGRAKSRNIILLENFILSKRNLKYSHHPFTKKLVLNIKYLYIGYQSIFVCCLNTPVHADVVQFGDFNLISYLFISKHYFLALLHRKPFIDIKLSSDGSLGSIFRCNLQIFPDPQTWSHLLATKLT